MRVLYHKDLSERSFSKSAYHLEISDRLRCGRTEGGLLGFGVGPAVERRGILGSEGEELFDLVYFL